MLNLRNWLGGGLVLLLASCGGSSGASTTGVPIPGFDDDGDGLSNEQELTGYEILVDEFGLGEGHMTRRIVTSDPNNRDTDGDLLSDGQEFELKTDPRRKDTDGDGWTDEEEHRRWLTSPTSVDSDGDARGPDGNLPARIELFDREEYECCKTSPLLADTDGDGKTDFEEAEDPFRHPLIAELPGVDLDIVGDVDVRLNVNYAEQEGVTTQYGTTLTRSTSSSQSRSSSQAHRAHVSVGFTQSIEASFPAGVKASQSLSFEAGYAFTATFTSSSSSSQSASRQHSEYKSESRNLTESAASGRISTGIRITNTSRSTPFRIANLAITVLRRIEGLHALDPGEFRTMATLRPVVPSFVLAPGETSPVIQVAAEDVNADVIKSFLARPDTLVFEPAVFDMENERGIDYAFLLEKTHPRTAQVEIDLGDGTRVRHRVATNVNRSEDGRLAGITIGEILADVLDEPYEVVEAQDENGTPLGVSMLTRLMGKHSDLTPNVARPTGFWTLSMSRENYRFDDEGKLRDFATTPVFAGESVLLTFHEDLDGDGLSTLLERFLGTAATSAESATPGDSDKDGLTDEEEFLIGWTVFGTDKQVYSNPVLEDSDGDELSDAAEKAARTDPTDPDTDGDSLPDGIDPFPTVPARRLHVDASKTSAPSGPTAGLSWAEAYPDLPSAIAEARRRNDTSDADHDPVEEVSEIWVARGTYFPSNTPNLGATLDLPGKVGIFGGFLGFETKRGQRNADPLTNETTLSGDYAQDDDDTEPNSLLDNAYRLVVASEAGAVLDGFTATATTQDGAIRIEGAVRLANLYLIENRSTKPGGALVVTAPGSTIADCTFSRNESRAWYCGGAVAIRYDADDFPGSSGETRFVDCRFLENAIRDTSLQQSDLFFGNRRGPTDDQAARGGALWVDAPNARVVLTASRFIGNRAVGGGAVALARGELHVQDCWFSNNDAASNAAHLMADDGSFGGIGSPPAKAAQGVYLYRTVGVGGAILVEGGRLVVLQSAFYRNSAIHAAAVSWGRAGRTDLIQCTFAQNEATGLREDLTYTLQPSGVVFDVYQDWPGATVDARGVAANCLFEGMPEGREEDTVVPHVQEMDCRFCLLDVWQAFGGAGNLFGDPRLEGAALGNLKPKSDSPAIDAGNRFLDANPATPAVDALPQKDLGGDLRVVDGNLDGSAEVDIGAYESQG